MRTITRAVVCCLLCATAFAQSPYRIGDARTIGRVDVSAQLPESMATNCVLWIKPTYNDGTNYYDLSRSANNGTATNAASTATWTAGSPSYLAFDGVNDAAQMADIDLGQTFTVAAWVLLNGTNLNANQSMLVKGTLNGDATSELSFYYNRIVNRYRFFTMSSTNGLSIVSADAFGNVPTNAWNFVAAFKSTTAIGISVNGGSFTTTVNTNNMKNGTNPLMLGQTSIGVSGALNGRIANAMLFNRALSGTEITNLYTFTKGQLGL